MSDLLRMLGQPTTPPDAGESCGCHDVCCAVRVASTPMRDAAWLRAARWAFLLAWASLLWMATEGAIGLYAGIAAGSIALMAWALGSVIEGLASIIVVWRFSGSRRLSETAERQAQRAVAISFWLLAPYVAIESTRNLAGEHHAQTSIVGIVLTGSSVVLMPVLGAAKHRLANRLDSGATAGEGTQNYMCAAQGAAVMVTLLATAVWSAAWWLDGLVGLVIAAWSGWEGWRAWKGEECC